MAQYINHTKNLRLPRKDRFSARFMKDLEGVTDAAVSSIFHDYVVRISLCVLL